MYKVHYSGKTAVCDDKDEALDQLLTWTNASLDEYVITPDQLTAQYEGPSAWSDWDDDKQFDVLNDEVSLHCPIGEIAREAVAAEMERQYREENPPADAVPWDSDTYEYDVHDWFDGCVNRSAFTVLEDDDQTEPIVFQVEDAIIDDVRDEMQSLWNDYPHSLDEMDALSEAQAESIYETGYTTPIDLDGRASEGELAKIVGSETAADVTDELSDDSGGLEELFG